MPSGDELSRPAHSPVLAPSRTLVYCHEGNDSLLSHRRCSCRSAELPCRHSLPLCWLAVLPALEGAAEPLHRHGRLLSAFRKADSSAAASGPGRCPPVCLRKTTQHLRAPLFFFQANSEHNLQIAGENSASVS